MRVNVHPTTYTCEVCGQEYHSSDLAWMCERQPALANPNVAVGDVVRVRNEQGMPVTAIITGLRAGSVLSIPLFWDDESVARVLQQDGPEKFQRMWIQHVWVADLDVRLGTRECESGVFEDVRWALVSDLTLLFESP